MREPKAPTLDELVGELEKLRVQTWTKEMDALLKQARSGDNPISFSQIEKFFAQKFAAFSPKRSAIQERWKKIQGV